jgi:hypothetical protein
MRPGSQPGASRHRKLCRIPLLLLSGALLLVGCASDAEGHPKKIGIPATAQSNLRKTTVIFTFAKGVDLPKAQRFLKEHGALSVTIYKTLSETNGQIMGSAVFPDSPTLLEKLRSSPLIQSIDKEHIVKPF